VDRTGRRFRRGAVRGGVPGRRVLFRRRGPGAGAAGGDRRRRFRLQHLPAAGRRADRTDRAETIRQALRDVVFWVLAAAFVAQTCAVSAISVLLVTMLRSLGHSPGFAATVAGLIGVLSVTGRLTTTAAGRRWSVGAVTAAAFVVQAAGAPLLPLSGRSAVGAVGCVLAFGLGFGVSTIARPAILADRYGTTAYATLSAAWGVPMTLMKALAPLGIVALWHAAGLTVALDVAAVCCLLGAAGLAVAEVARPQLPSPTAASLPQATVGS
jgi:hypothetical protein